MVEDTKLVATFSSSDSPDSVEGEEKQIETLASIPPNENVRLPGSDVKQGSLVMRKGEKISGAGGEVGSLAFVGREEVKVVKKPVVAILSTGNELVDLHGASEGKREEEEEWGGIYDTNRPSLRAALEALGYEVVDLGIVPDK